MLPWPSHQLIWLIHPVFTWSEVVSSVTTEFVMPEAFLLSKRNSAKLRGDTRDSQEARRQSRVFLSLPESVNEAELYLGRSWLSRRIQDGLLVASPRRRRDTISPWPYRLGMECRSWDGARRQLNRKYLYDRPPTTTRAPEVFQSFSIACRRPGEQGSARVETPMALSVAPEQQTMARGPLESRTRSAR